MDRVARVALCCLVVAWGLGPALVVGVASPDVAAASEESPAALEGTTVSQQTSNGGGEEQPALGGFDEIYVGIDLMDNGSAAWTTEYRYRLDDENATEDWEALKENIDDRPGAYIISFRERNSGLVSDAENVTERNMSTSNYSVETEESSSPQGYGYVRFQFEWSAFSRVEVNRIEAGGALEGFTMDERTQLSVTWPEEYGNVTISPEPDDGSENAVIWYGDETREFVEGEPYIELIRTGGEPVDAIDDDDGGLPSLWMLGAGAVLVVVIGTTGAVAWNRSRSDDASGAQREPRSEPAPAPAEETEPESEAATPPPELLSNEERVLGLLSAHGGRIKQQEVVSELDWTEAKTSQVVSGLREDGEIEVFRIGRENVLALDEDTETSEE